MYTNYDKNSFSISTEHYKYNSAYIMKANIPY